MGQVGDSAAPVSGVTRNCLELWVGCGLEWRSGYIAPRGGARVRCERCGLPSWSKTSSVSRGFTESVTAFANRYSLGLANQSAKNTCQSFLIVIRSYETSQHYMCSKAKSITATQYQRRRENNTVRTLKPNNNSPPQNKTHSET